MARSINQIVNMLLVCVLFAVTVASSPILYINRWVAPGPFDSRGPCPMLNTLANHGYLPHDGKNIAVEQFGEAVSALNFHPDFGLIPAGMFANATGKRRFDLAELNAPGIEQHIASLTRRDWDRYHPHLEPDSRRIDDMLADSKTDFLTVDSLAVTRNRLEAASRPRELRDSERELALMEASLVLVLMMDGPIPTANSRPDPSVYSASKKRIRFWLNEERFPVDYGWSPSDRQLTFADLQPAMDAIAAHMRRHRRRDEIER